MQKILSNVAHFITGVDPVADVWGAGTSYTDIISAKNAQAVTFVMWTGVGSTGTATLTVQACDDTSATNSSAVVFRYRACLDTGASDVFGALTLATTSGFTTTASTSNHGQMYLVHVDCDVLAPLGYGYLRLKMVEVVNDPVLGGVLVILHPLGADRAITSTQIT